MFLDALVQFRSSENIIFGYSVPLDIAIYVNVVKNVRILGDQNQACDPPIFQTTS